MTFLPALAAWQWAIMALIPAGILLLYFLKLRRQPVIVPSTFLWRKSIEDLHVNSLLQRLRSSPLLWLQLIATSLAAIALLRPGFSELRRTDSRRIFLLDASASMQARDVGNTATRFDLAKEKILAQVDAMTDEDVAMVMSVSDRVDVLQSFTSDRRRLREAVAGATVTNRVLNFESAWRAADGMAQVRGDDSPSEDVQKADKKTTVVFFSDGGLDSKALDDTTSIALQYVRLGKSATSNLAVIAFSCQRSEAGDDIEVFATIANFGNRTASSPVSLFVDDQLVDADQIELAPGEDKGLSFQLTPRESARLRLVLDADDQLEIDNQAFATLSAAGTVPVLLVTEGNQPLELALSTGPAAKRCAVEVVKPDYLTSDAYRTRAASGSDRLIIFDRCKPAQMPATNTFFIGELPPQGWSWISPPAPVLLVDIDRAHPIMRYLDLFSILIAEGRSLSSPAGSTDLLSGESGPVLALAPREGFEDLVLGFELISTAADGTPTFNTDWQVQRSWPVFVFNAARYLTGTIDATEDRSYRPGDTATLMLEAGRGELTLRKPTGDVERISREANGRVSVPLTDPLGIYEIEDEVGVQQRFSVNLFSRLESSLDSPETLQTNLGDIAIAEDLADGRREFWRWILLAMLGVLTVEWLYYGRRLV